MVAECWTGDIGLSDEKRNGHSSRTSTNSGDFFGCDKAVYGDEVHYTTERIFLRKVGGGYIFVHRLLMEYFASLYQGE